MGTHADLTRPIDAHTETTHLWFRGEHRAEGQPMLGQTQAVIADLGTDALGLTWVITLEDAEDAVYLATSPCETHGAHDYFCQWDGESLAEVDFGDSTEVIPLLTLVGIVVGS